MRRLIVAVFMVGVTGFAFAGCGGSDDDGRLANGPNGGNGGGGGGNDCRSACTNAVDVCVPSVLESQKEAAVDRCTSDCTDGDDASDSALRCASNASSCSEVLSCEWNFDGGGNGGGGETCWSCCSDNGYSRALSGCDRDADHTACVCSEQDGNTYTSTCSASLCK